MYELDIAQLARGIAIRTNGDFRKFKPATRRLENRSWNSCGTRRRYTVRS
jgi:hypothetical protein